MVVAGDHANNDMAGEDADSWLSQFKASGSFDSVDTQIAGPVSYTHLDRDDHSKAQGILTSRSLTTGLLCQQAFSDTTITVEEELLKSCPCPDKWDRERFTWEQEYDRLFTGFGFSKEDKRKRLSPVSYTHLPSAAPDHPYALHKTQLSYRRASVYSRL